MEKGDAARQVTWEDLAQTSTSTTTNTTWDFTPFLSAPAVKEKSREEGRVNLLKIPQTKVPSPLANNISPRQVIDIRESLVGKDGGIGCGGNGKEIWLSWKRAWDLWNNHYIEGRVNPLWVGEEWERREKAKREWDVGRDDRRRKAEREKVAAAGGHPPVDPKFNPLRPKGEVPRPKPALEKNTIKSPRRRGSSAASKIGINAPHVARAHRGPATHGPGVNDVEMLDRPEDALVEFRNDEESSDSEPPPLPTTNPDGSSAGWFPIKNLPEYYEPEDDNYDGKVWVDNVANTVWRPRRLGEKKLQIDLDIDIEQFRRIEINVDGGVDCSRSPFPVLRPLTQYIRTAEGAFRKKKAWDGVTGTIFNMPTQPIEPCADTKDEKTLRIKEFYSDPFRDHPQDELFPVDIRRVLKVTSELENPKDICDKGEELVRDPALYPKKFDRDIETDDPWWVEDSQKLARDAPPRFHPPVSESATLGEQLPLDDQLWKQEAGRDLTYNAGYFVTNLHGGTLVVNGMEIKKGDVAGPLPAFAIIESLGGQVSFWWGVGGRHYGVGPAGVDLSTKWEILRQIPGWDHVAVTAGEVWDAKIKDRKEREKTGEDEDDDEEWEGYKRTKKADKPSYEKSEERRQPGRYGPIPSLTNDDDELKWLFFQKEEKKRMLSIKRRASSLIYPNDGAFWGGFEPKSELWHELSENKKYSRWIRLHRNEQVLLQKAINEKVANEKAKHHAIELEKEKRKAEGYLQSFQKRRKIAGEARQSAAAREVERVQKLFQARAVRERTMRVEADSLSDAATMAAMFGNRGLSSREQVVAFQQWKKKEDDRLETQRRKKNIIRRESKQTEVQAPEKLDLASMEATLAMEKENARRKVEQRRGEVVARHVQNLAKQKTQRDAREAADKKRIADAASKARLLAEHRVQQDARIPVVQKQLDDTNLLAKRQLENDAEEQKRLADARHAEYLAKQQAEQDDQEEADRQAETSSKAQDLAKETQRVMAQMKGTLEAPTFDQSVQGQLLALEYQYYTTPDGPARVRIAQAYVDRLRTSRSEAEKTSYTKWIKAQPISDVQKMATTFHETSMTIKEAKDASSAKTQTEKSKLTDIATKSPPASFFERPPSILTSPKQAALKLRPLATATSPLRKSPYPSTIDEQLALALQEGDSWDPDVQQAIADSLKTHAKDARESLEVRASSLNMTEDEWARTQNYADAKAWLAAELKSATGDTQPPISPRKPRTKKMKDDDHLTKYRDDMLKAIEQGIQVLAALGGFKSEEDFAADQGWRSLDDMARAELEGMNITLKDIPSRKHTSVMDMNELLWENMIWREWVARLEAAAKWKERIIGLPGGPAWSKKTMENGKARADV